MIPALGLAAFHPGCSGSGVGLDLATKSLGPPFARVVEMSDSQSVGGPMAMGKAGDWLMENEKLGVVIRGLENRGGFAFSGGNIIDAAPRGAHDLLAEIFTYFDDTFQRQAVYHRLEPEELSDSTWVSLVARGEDSENPDLKVETRYVLAPGSNFLEIETTVSNSGPDSVFAFELGDAIEWGRAEPFAPGPGRDLIGRRQVVPYLLGSDGRTSYAWINTEGDCAGPHGKIWSDPFYKIVDLFPGESVSYRRRLGVFSGSADIAGAAAWTMRGRQVGILEVEVVGGRGKPIAGAQVDAWDEMGLHIGWGVTGPSGILRLSLLVGDYRLEVDHPHHGVEHQTGVKIKENVVTQAGFRLQEPAHLSLFVNDERGRPCPARWTFEGVDGTKTPDLGPNYMITGANAHVFTPNGKGKTAIRPGKYRIIVSRGPSFESWETVIKVRAGSDLNLRAQLVRLPIPQSWLAADFHVHSHRSPDSGVTLADRARSLVCEGIDWFAASDHGWRTDYGAVLDTLDLAAPLRFMVSEEVTTSEFGHFGGFPLIRRPELPAAGGMLTHNVDLDDVFQFLRDENSTALIQVNHPRAGRNGYFDLVGGPESADSTGLRLDFDVLEIMNGKSQGSFRTVWKDWMTLLRMGRKVTGVGNSDTHLLSGEEAGYPRNYILLDSTGVDEETVVDAVREGRVMATNGPLIHFTLEGAKVGSTVTRRAGTVRGHIKVLASSWVDVRRVIVCVNGQDDSIFMVRGRDRVVRFDEDIELELRSSSFVLVRVEGDDSLEPVLPPLRSNKASIPVTPLAFTNPIWVEITGASRE